MIKRVIYIGNPALLKTKDEQLLIEFTSGENKGETKVIPIEDIGLVEIDHYQVMISHGAMNRLIENNTLVLICNSKHIPSGLMLPFEGHTTFSETLRSQVSATEPLTKQLWQQTVKSKIFNQAKSLEYAGENSNALKELLKEVKSGDTTNTEGRAANIYWRKFFGNDSDFKRRRFGSPPNHLLNYGYAILRSVIARSIVGSGLLPALGIHHKNKYNPMCLADDIMEPYRPYVDKLVLDIVTEFDGDIPAELDKNLKSKLLIIPVMDIEINNEKSPLLIATNKTTSSLAKCFLCKTRKLEYPQFHY